MNLLELFSLRHTQVTHVHAELHEQVANDQRIQAKIELNLTPKEMSGNGQNSMPAFQISVGLTCVGELQGAKQPAFNLQVVMQAAYQQVQGEAMKLAEFSQHHSTLTRQLYPLAHQHLRGLMLQVGLEQVKLPYDLLNTGGAAIAPQSLH